MRNFKAMPQTANLQAEYELAGLTIPQDRIVVLSDAAAYSTANPMIGADGAPYFGYGSPNMGEHRQAGRPQ